MQLYDLREIEEHAILIGVQTEMQDDIDGSMEELSELARTAGAKVVGKLIQKREAIHPGTYIGKGKIEELQTMISESGANLVICDDELSPIQLRNLEREINCKIIDRSLLILDIFAGRAKSSEGKIQVELAQLRYRATRLTGLGVSLSRLGGGIGTRGPGEKKLEMDRRLIRTRISQLKRELEGVRQHRDLIHQQRKKAARRMAALVGYSNSGKSSGMNALTQSDIYEDDLLFATLDTTTRLLELPDKQEILLIDTVGFIRKLPHHLIEAFRSTLEEAQYADILIHVVDTSNPQMEMQMNVVYETLRQLQIVDKPIITLFNKQDKLENPGRLRDFQADYSIATSMKTGQGLEELKETLAEILKKDQIYIEKVFPYENAGEIQIIRKNGQLLEEKYVEEGISIKAYVPEKIYGKLLQESRSYAQISDKP